MGAIAVLIVAELGLMQFHASLPGIVVSLVLFFTAFNLLEASLPSLISRLAPAARKGTAMGVYSSSQFLGAFLGGALGGWCYGAYGFAGVFAANAVVCAVWLVVAAGMRKPARLKSYILNVGTMEEDEARLLATELTAVAGVAEAVVIVEEGVAYLKVDDQALDREALNSFSAVGV